MIYLIIGLIWCFWLEWYTTSKLWGEIAKDWLWRERFFHTFLWPISLTLFLVELFKNIRN